MQRAFISSLSLLRKVKITPGVARYSAGHDEKPVSHRYVAAHGHTEKPDDFNSRMLKFFQSSTLDGFMLRQGMNELQGHDLVPEPEIVVAVLKACRKVNDLAIAIRFLEAIKLKAQGNPKIWPWLKDQINPTLQDLGIPTPEDIGFDKPEFYWKLA